MQRKSSLDILRILAMWFIMTAHFFGWGGAVNSLTSHDLNYYWVMPLYFASQVGNTLFFMLSGYFANRPRKEKILFLERKTAFYSTIITWIGYAIGEITIEYAFQGMFPLLFKKYWFISVYLILYVLEIVLLPGLNALSKEHFIIVIIVLLINNTIVDNAKYTLLEGLLGFIIGYYIKRYDIFTGRKITTLFLLYAILMIAYSIERIIVLRLNVEHCRVDEAIRYVLLLAAATVLFGLFTRIHINWKWPGKISNNLLSVYLITSNSAISSLIYERILRVTECSERLFFFIYYIGVNGLLLLFCIEIDVLITKINSFETRLWLATLNSHFKERE